MNILLIGHERDKNGASMSLLNIISVLEKDPNNHISVLTGFTDGPFREALREHRVQVLEIPIASPYIRKRSVLRWAKSLLRYLLIGIHINRRASRIVSSFAVSQHIEVIHSNSSVLTVGALISRRTGIPHVMHIREFRDLDFNFIPLVPEKWLAALRDHHTRAFICVSKAVADHNVMLDPEKKRIVYNGIDRNNLLVKPERETDAPIQFIIAGRISPEKGQDEAVKAAALLVKRGFDNFHLSIAGSGELTEPIPKCVKDRVSLLGYIHDMPAVRQMMDVELVCSRAEAFGRITAEAMMGGMPVIGSDTGGTPELICEGETGFLYEYGNAEALANRMAFFIEHPEAITVMGHKAQAYAIQNFTIERCVKEIIDVYREVMRQP